MLLVGRQVLLRTLVVLHHVPQVVTTRVVRLAHAHGVVGEVDITVVAYRVGSSQLSGEVIGAYRDGVRYKKLGSS